MERSPLWMVTQEPRLNEFVSYLSAFMARRRDPEGGVQELVFSRRELAEVRQAFAGMLLRGERKLHQLCEQLCDRLFGSYKLSSVVFGEVDSTKERFVLTQDLSPQDLYSTLDIDLGTRQLRKLRFHDGRDWSTASLVANVVEYQPTEPNTLRIHKLISRIKAEEEIWNKVVDEIFDLDAMVKRDKQISHLSPFVKDVFGLKVVVDRPSDVREAHSAILSTAGLQVFETKDYLGPDGKKQSGWEAMKSVVSWEGRTFEIQVQPLRVYYDEREYLTKESHAGFKSRREHLRDKIAEEQPLFGFCRELLQWLFVSGASSGRVPIYPGIQITIKS